MYLILLKLSKRFRQYLDSMKIFLEVKLREVAMGGWRTKLFASWSLLNASGRALFVSTRATNTKKQKTSRKVRSAPRAVPHAASTSTNTSPCP